MSTFIVRIELHPSDPDQASSAVHAAMEAAGFSRVYQDRDGVRYHLPTSEYCITSEGTVTNVLELARKAAGSVTSQFMTLVSNTKQIAIAGLVPVSDGRARIVAPPAPMARALQTV